MADIFCPHDYFAFLPACTIFILKMKIGCASATKTNKFVLHFSRLVLSLPTTSKYYERD